MVGDFNVNLLGNPSHLFRHNSLLSHLSSLYAKLSVSLPTHFFHLGTPSIIDLVFIPSSFKAQISINPPIGTSDHNTILTSIPFPLAAPPPKPSPKMSWKYHLADFSSINESLCTIHWDTILPPNIDAAWSTFSNIFVSIIHNYTPYQVIPSFRFPPWFPHSLIRKIHNLYRQAVNLYRQAVIHSFSQYRTLRNSIVHDIQKAKSSYLCSLSISSRSFWSHVRSLCKSCSTDGGKANLLNTTFADFFTKDPLLPPLPPLFLACSPDLCSAESVSKLIDCLPNDTTPGPDAISSLLKATASAISYPLSLLFNLSIISGFIPSAWKASIVVPIPKTSPPSDSPSDYRPISLLSLVYKLLEKHIANILFAHLLSRNLIPPNQFGFVPSRSASDALTSACHLIFSSLDSLSSSCGVFLDLRKDFDSVSHSGLLEKLYSLDLPPNLCSWLYSYLSGRSQHPVNL